MSGASPAQRHVGSRSIVGHSWPGAHEANSLQLQSKSKSKSGGLPLRGTSDPPSAARHRTSYQIAVELALITLVHIAVRSLQRLWWWWPWWPPWWRHHGRPRAFSPTPLVVRVWRLRYYGRLLVLAREHGLSADLAAGAGPGAGSAHMFCSAPLHLHWLFINTPFI
jgi:hypothetical protein